MEPFRFRGYDLPPALARELERLGEAVRAVASGTKKDGSGVASNVPSFTTRDDVVELLKSFAAPSVSGSSDPLLSQLSTSSGSVTSVAVTASGNLSTTGSPITSAGTINVSLSATPSFTTVTMGNAKCRGYTTSVLPPSVTEYPNDKDWGIHEDTGAAKFYLAFNRSGAIKKVELL